MRQDPPRPGGAAAHPALLRLAAALACVALAGPALGAQLERLQREDHPFVAPARGEAAPEWPRFDARATLRWDGPLRATAIAECAPVDWRLWTSEPRVEEAVCSDAQGALLRRLDGPADERWRYRLDHNGPRARVAGHDEGGLLLDTLWRIDLATGAASDLIAAHPARRSLRASAPMVADAASVYFARSPSGTFTRGSILALDRDNAAQRVVASLPRRGLLSRWQARDLAVSADGRWLFVALEEDWRGPSRVGLGVLDLRDGRWHAIDEHCIEGHCTQPRVVRHGTLLGFAFRDLRTAQVALLRYRWRAD